jgi:hypothetical protein
MTPHTLLGILNAVNLARTPGMLAGKLGIPDQPGWLDLASALLKARDEAGGHLSDSATLQPLLESQPGLLPANLSGSAEVMPASTAAVTPTGNPAASAAPAGGLSPTSHRVLSSLASSVGALADRAAATSRIYNEIGPAFQDYVHAARSILTGTEMPVSESPTGSAPITAPQPSAVAATQAFGGYLSQMADALAATGTSTAQELQNVNKKEIEEKTGGGTTTGGGVSIPAGSGGGTTGSGGKQPGSTNPPTSGGSGGNGASVGKGGNGTISKQPVPGQPARTPATPVSHPASVSRPLKQVERRCYQFKIRNQGKDGDISDIFFTGMTPAVQPNVPVGWQGLIGTPANPGFGWQVKSNSPEKILKPGQVSPEFGFCLDNPASSNIFLSHPDKTQTKLGPGDLLVNGSPPRVNKNGDPIITSTNRSYITQYEVTVGDSGTVSLTLPGGGATGISGTEPKGQHLDGVASTDGKTVTLGGQFPPGTVISVEVQTRGPNATAQVNPTP